MARIVDFMETPNKRIRRGGEARTCSGENYLLVNMVARAGGPPLGLNDKERLSKTFGKQPGKASVTGYCIRFRALKDISIGTLEAAIRYGFAAQNEKGKLTK